MNQDRDLQDKDIVKTNGPIADVSSVPPFIQIVTAVSNAFGRGADEAAMSDVLYGLDAQGRVWEWNYADPEWKGSRDGWELLPNTSYIEGAAPPAAKKTR